MTIIPKRSMKIDNFKFESKVCLPKTNGTITNNNISQGSSSVSCKPKTDPSLIISCNPSIAMAVINDAQIVRPKICRSTFFILKVWKFHANEVAGTVSY